MNYSYEKSEALLHIKPKRRAFETNLIPRKLAELARMGQVYGDKML